MNSRDEYARDRDGRILTDRFGRPVRRRPAPGPASNTTPTDSGSGQKPAPPRYVRSNIPDAAGQHRSPAPGSEHGRRERAQLPEPPRYRQAPPADTPQRPRHSRGGYAQRPAAAPSKARTARRTRRPSRVARTSSPRARPPPGRRVTGSTRSPRAGRAEAPTGVAPAASRSAWSRAVAVPGAQAGPAHHGVASASAGS